MSRHRDDVFDAATQVSVAVGDADASSPSPPALSTIPRLLIYSPEQHGRKLPANVNDANVNGNPWRSEEIRLIITLLPTRARVLASSL